MGTVTTTYDVVTRYMMETSGAGPKLAEMEKQVRSVQRAHDGMTDSLKRFATYAAGMFGIHEAKKSLIDYNSTMEQSRIQMAGLMAQAGKGDFVGNLDVASTLMRQMRDDAAKTVGTTQDYVQMASQLIQPLTMAGAKIEDIRDMTRLSVVASKAMGIDAIVAARDVDQAVRGMYRSVDQFTGKLLTPLGYGGEEGRKKFNALSMEQRFMELKRAEKSPAIEAMARAQENTFEGVYSTLESKIKETLGIVGMPLFKKLTEEIGKWNDWLQKNEKLVEQIATAIGEKIVQAAITFRDAIKFAAEHWKSIVASYAALKAAGYLAAAGGVAGVAGGVGGAAVGAAGIGFGAKAAAVSLVASVVYIGGIELTQWIAKRQDENIRLAGLAGPDLLMDIQRRGGGTIKNSLEGRGFLSGNELNRAEFSKALEAMSFEQRGTWAKAFGIKQMGSDSINPEGISARIAEAMAIKFADILKQEMEWGSLATGDSLGMYAKYNTKDIKPEKTKVNVTINRIEVASEDPDRFTFGMINVFRQAARNPSGVGAQLHALAEG